MSEGPADSRRVLFLSCGLFDVVAGLSADELGDGGVLGALNLFGGADGYDFPVLQHRYSRTYLIDSSPLSFSLM